MPFMPFIPFRTFRREEFKNKKLTRLWAAYICWRIWNQTPSNQNQKVKKAQKFGDFYMGCPACTYLGVSPNFTRCTTIPCILISTWSLNSPKPLDYCEQPHSVYWQWWENSDLEDRYDRDFFALVIAEGAKEIFMSN